MFSPVAARPNVLPAGRQCGGVGWGRSRTRPHVGGGVHEIRLSWVSPKVHYIMSAFHETFSSNLTKWFVLVQVVGIEAFQYQYKLNKQMYGVQNNFFSKPRSQKMIYRKIQRNHSLLKTNFSNLVTTLAPCVERKRNQLTRWCMAAS